jgi:trk system potassium uptake protein TrkH
LTTAGFSSVDYTLWGGLSIGLSFFLMYVGGCAGSSAGGMKIMRVAIVAKALVNHLKTLTFPNGVFTLKFQNKKVNQPLLVNVMGFLCLYVVCNTVLAVLLALTGQDLLTSISGAAAAMGNIGPGLGSIIGPMGGYSDLNNSAKWLLMAGMVIGRLEIFAVLVIFSRKFWQK